MLDQNTDRMWYVIGAIVIGAAIIAMGLNIFSDSLDSVDGMMTSLTNLAGENVISVSIDPLIADGYIPVATADELNNIRKNEVQTFGLGTKWESEYESGLDMNYVQVADIDLSQFDNWVPIGDVPNPFTGIFDGSGFDIQNITVNRPDTDYVGLFGNTNEALLKNIRAISVDIKGSHGVGGVVGSLNINNTLSNCYSSGNVSGIRLVGGIAGRQRDSEITNSSSSADIIGRDEGQKGHVGGLVGHNRGSIVGLSYSTGSVIGSNNIGGLVGSSWEKPSLIDNSYSTSKVLGDSAVGGLIGSSHGTVTNSAWANDINIGLPGIGSTSNDSNHSNINGYSLVDVEGIIENLFK